MRHTVHAGTSIICPRYFRGRGTRCEKHIEPVTTGPGLMTEEGARTARISFTSNALMYGPARERSKYLAKMTRRRPLQGEAERHEHRERAPGHEEDAGG